MPVGKSIYPEKNMNAPLCLGPDLNPRRPKTDLPPNATDCHCHVFPGTEAYPLVAQRTYTPATASLSEYLRMCDAVGIGRTVQVNASVYGSDNSLTLDIIKALGKHRARGVAGISLETGSRELERLHEGGMRGFRLSTHVKGYGGIDHLAALAGRIEPFGWHVQLHFNRIAELVPLEDQLMRMSVPLVFDHLGGVRGNERKDNAGFQALLRILRQRENSWVKISSWYRRSESGSPSYEDMKPFAQALVDARPDGVVFGTNWPHPNLFSPDQVPNDGDLIDTFCEWVPDANVRERILVTNPERLYGFGE
jgi:predicted TIM-barrel fold metal-dependent hydrolase